MSTWSILARDWEGKMEILVIPRATRYRSHCGRFTDYRRGQATKNIFLPPKSSRQPANHAPTSSASQFSNRAKGIPRNATVILFDLLNLGVGAQPSPQMRW